MSFDIAIWRTGKPLGDEAAGLLYSRLLEGDMAELEPHSSIDAFYRDLVARYPEIDDVPAEKMDDTTVCPWSCGIDRSPAYLVVSCLFSAVEAVCDYIGELQVKHGLCVYIPAEGKEYTHYEE